VRVFKDYFFTSFENSETTGGCNLIAQLLAKTAKTLIEEVAVVSLILALIVPKYIVQGLAARGITG
jgi:hypothetical protein